MTVNGIYEVGASPGATYALTIYEGTFDLEEFDDDRWNPVTGASLLSAPYGEDVVINGSYVRFSGTGRIGWAIKHN